MNQKAVDQRERRQMLDGLISWLNTTEVLLRSDRLTLLHHTAPSQADDSTSVFSSETTSTGRVEGSSIGFDVDVNRVERLLAENAHFEMEMKVKRVQYSEILKHARKVEAPPSRKPSTSTARQRASKRLASQVPSPCPPVYASARINDMCERWRRVEKIIQAKRMALEERCGHAREVERLKTFEFDTWRRKYLAWMNDKKARLVDMFRRYDVDRDGRLTREEFIKAMIDSSKH